MKILLVDDSAKHRRAGVEQLTVLGHEVVALSDYTEALERAMGGEYFDAALLDLLMPAEATMLGDSGMALLGQPFAVGYALAVLIALAGVPFVAVATDTNHHNHPASAVMDWFPKSTIQIEDSKVIFMHAPLCAGGEKNWALILERVTQKIRE